MSHKASLPLQTGLHFVFCKFPPRWSLVVSTFPCWVPCPESLAGGVAWKTLPAYVWVYGGLSRGLQVEAVESRGSGQGFEGDYPEHWLVQGGCCRPASQGPCFPWHSRHLRGVCCINDRARATWATPSGVGLGTGREAVRYTGRDERAESALPGS